MTGQSLRWSPDQLRNYQRKCSGVRAGDVTSVRLKLPMPPSVNCFTETSRRAGPKTAVYKAFVARVAEVIAEAGNPRIEGRLSVSVDMVPPDNRRRDLDNVLKALNDAMQHAGLFADDSQIDRLTIQRMPVFIAGESSVVVTITRIVGAA